MKAHQLDIFLRAGRLYVVPSLPSRRGMEALDAVVAVAAGWAGLAESLREGERLAMDEAARPPAKRRRGNLERLLEAAGVATLAEFTPGTTVCSIVRVPDYVLVMKLVAGRKPGVLEGTSLQDQYPADTSIEKLADIARQVLESTEPE